MFFFFQLFKLNTSSHALRGEEGSLKYISDLQHDIELRVCKKSTEYPLQY